MKPLNIKTFFIIATGIILQSIPSPLLKDIDFLFIILLYIAYIYDLFWYLTYSLTSAFIFWLLSDIPLGSVAINYVLIPIFARKISQILSLDIKKYVFISSLILVGYIIINLAIIESLNFTNFSVFFVKNFIVLCFLYLFLRKK